MPFIDLKTNKELSKELIEAVKADLGEAITAIPGKSEAWLMVKAEGGADMFFKGDGSDCAMFDVAIFGSASDSAYDELTARICKISEERLSVPASRTYVKYSEYSHWGWNGMNF